MSILPSGRVSQLPSGRPVDLPVRVHAVRHNLVPQCFDAWRNGLSGPVVEWRVQKSFAAALLLLALMGPSRPARAAGPSPQATAATAGATAAVAAAAKAFLATLSESDRAKVVFRFDDAAQRARWSNLPSGIFERAGLRLGDLTAVQREAALKIMATALSRDGYRKITQIMKGDEVLKTAGGGQGGAAGPSAGRGGPGAGPGGPGAGPGGPGAGPGAPGGPRGGPGGGPGRGPGGGGVKFGADEYYVAFLGTPSETAPWMLQFGGHHLAINVTMVGRANVMTPSLPAAQPATYTLDGETIRPLGKENDKAFELINALDAGQRKQAILNYQVSDLVLGAGQDGKTIQPEGILASVLTPAQQAMLLDLVHEWVGILNDEGATPRMAEIKSSLANTYFAWSGPVTNGSAAYFRIQGPTLVIEYAPQRDVTHIHTIYRDPTNDYGVKLVK
jgi:hypothetical protein